MHCQNCGNPIELENHFCPNCGNSLKKKNSVHTLLQEAKKPAWLRIISWFAALFLLMAGIYWIAYESPEGTIEKQLKSIRSGQLTEAYYKYTTEAFQKATSLENFRKFISSYPVLEDNRTFIQASSSTKNKIATIKGELISSEEEAMNVEYLLQKENGDWKIASVRFPSPLNNYALNLSLTQELLTVIDTQLELIQANQVSKAYSDYTSKEFQEKTPLKKFQVFLQEHPIFFDFDHVQYQRRSIENNIGLVQLLLSDEEGSHPIEYRLIQQEGQWKIWSIQVPAVQQGEGDPSAMVQRAIEAQLYSFFQEDPETAYYSSSSQFQEQTSLSTFRNFLKKFPMIEDHQAVIFEEPEIRGNRAKVTALFQNNRQELAISYTLGLEEGLWKIMGMEITRNAEQGSR